MIRVEAPVVSMRTTEPSGDSSAASVPKRAAEWASDHSMAQRAAKDASAEA